MALNHFLKVEDVFLLKFHKTSDRQFGCGDTLVADFGIGWEHVLMDEE